MRIGIDARIVTTRNSGLVDYVLGLLKHTTSSSENEFYIYCQEIHKKAFSSVSGRKNVYLRFTYFSNNFLDIKNFVFEQTNFVKLINKDKLDIYHNPFGYGIPFFLNTKTLLTIHDLIPLSSFDNLSYLQKLIYRVSLRISLFKADFVVTISEFTRNQLLAKYPSIKSSKVLTIHNGFDKLAASLSSNKTAIDIRTRYHIQDPYILYIGSGTKRKNLITLVKGFLSFKEASSRQDKLVIVSKFDRPETKKTHDEISKYAEHKGLISEIIFLGYLENLEKSAVLKNCDFFVYPTLYEGFGLPILEAMDFQKPIACSDIPALREVAGDAAIYFNPLDPNSIKESFITLTENSTIRKKLIENGEIQIKKYSWEKMDEKYLEIYGKLGKST